MDVESEVKFLRDRGVAVQFVRTYKEIEKIRQDFIVGYRGYQIPFLIVIGNPGVSKSHMFEKMEEAVFINNAASAFGLYVAAANNIDRPIILDDVDGLLKDPTAVSLIKALGTDRLVKLITWAKQISNPDIPPSFETRSRLCILCNEFPRANRNVFAVLSRAKVVIFDPPVQEVHEYVGTWWPQEHDDVYEFIGQNLRSIVRPDIRLYTIHALNEKKLGNDWRSLLIGLWQGEDSEVALLRVVAEISNTFTESPAQIAEWVKRTGKARSSWFTYQRRYRQAQGA